MSNVTDTRRACEATSTSWAGRKTDNKIHICVHLFKQTPPGNWKNRVHVEYVWISPYSFEHTEWFFESKWNKNGKWNVVSCLVYAHSPMKYVFKTKKNKCLPAGVIDVNFSASSCVGDALLLLAVLCGVNGGNELPCESMLARTVVGAVAVTRVPQKLKSNLLPDKRASRSRRHFSLSMCTWETWAKEKKHTNRTETLKKCGNVFTIIIVILSRNILIKLEMWLFFPTETKSHAVHKYRMFGEKDTGKTHSNSFKQLECESILGRRSPVEWKEMWVARSCLILIITWIFFDTWIIRCDGDMIEAAQIQIDSTKFIRSNTFF